MKSRGMLGFVALTALCVGCDHAAKAVAREALQGSPALSLAGGAVRFELAANPGAFLSLGAGLPPEVRSLVFLVLIPALVCAFLVSAWWDRRRPAAALALVAGGGLANWLDRLLHGGAVTDFVSLGLGPLRTGIFNGADVAILLGIALFALPRLRAAQAR